MSVVVGDDFCGQRQLPINNKDVKKRKLNKRDNVKTVVEEDDSEVDSYGGQTEIHGRHLPTLTENSSRAQSKRKPDVLSSNDSILLSSMQQALPGQNKKSKASSGSQETLMNVQDHMQPIRKKRRKKAQSEIADAGITNVGLASELFEIDEDVIPAKDCINNYNDTVFTIPVMRSEPVSKLFIEKKSGFKATDKTKVAQQRAEVVERQQALAEAISTVQKQNTIDFALSTHRIFKVISLFLQGLFAGIATWQIIASYMLLNQGSASFLSFYYMLASPVQCLFYFLFAVSTVAVLDRYDLARPTRLLLVKSVTLQAGTVVVVFYFTGLVISLATVFIDERISLYGVDPLLWNNSTQIESTKTYLVQWQILNLIRGITAVIGWFVVSLRTSTDRLTKNLLRADENVLGPARQNDDHFSLV